MDRKPRYKKPASEWSLKDEFTVFQMGPGTVAAFLRPDIDDYALVMVATSVIDTYLKFGLITRLRGLKAEGAKGKPLLAEVFSGEGPLSSFSAKISVFEAMGLLSEDERHDLNILRGVRNKFAHWPTERKLTDYPHLKTLKVSTTRDIAEAGPERLAFKRSSVGIIDSLGMAAGRSLAEWLVVIEHQEDIDEISEALKAASERGEDLAGVAARYRRPPRHD